MAWLKKPLPWSPLNNDEIGMNDIEITSGSNWTVWDHSLWDRPLLKVPPFLLHVNLTSCNWNIKDISNWKQTWFWWYAEVQNFREPPYRWVWLSKNMTSPPYCPICTLARRDNIRSKISNRRPYKLHWWMLWDWD